MFPDYYHSYLDGTYDKWLFWDTMHFQTDNIITVFSFSDDPNETACFPADATVMLESKV